MCIRDRVPYDYYHQMDSDMVNSIRQSSIDLKDKCKFARMMTGHVVYGTLIRCHFSPKESTGQRFVYSGGANSRIMVWDILTGENVGRLQKRFAHDDTIIRDCAWHPISPVLFSGDLDSCITRWIYNENKLTEVSA
eukprot:TRINITY_DN11836_c0_g1_i1.p1 TRINITY_DN11836_c0_g1~~TRINITY_DN11836_c0_g1_i1.p1  ORF type:complete len:136 (+),score=13.91 TRINITY_DN11836_c0_g1_i1:64-471(+)